MFFFFASRESRLATHKKNNQNKNVNKNLVPCPSLSISITLLSACFCFPLHRGALFSGYRVISFTLSPLVAAALEPGALSRDSLTCSSNLGAPRSGRVCVKFKDRERKIRKARKAGALAFGNPPLRTAYILPLSFLFLFFYGLSKVFLLFLV